MYYISDITGQIGITIVPGLQRILSGVCSTALQWILWRTIDLHRTGISIRFVNAIFLKISSRLASVFQQYSPCSGQVEIDES